MSLLLEALKRAALEKQNRSGDDALETGASGDGHKEGVMEEETHDFELSDHLSFDLDEVEEIEDHEWQDSLDLDLESQDLENQELDAKTPSLSPAAAIMALEKAKENNRKNSTAQTKTFIKPDEPAVANESIELDNERLAKEKEAEEQRLETLRVNEQLRQLEIEAEKIRVEENRQKELSRQEEEKQKLQLESRAALQDLLKSGERVEQKAKKRKFILYVVLILTALISLSIYYYIIIQNRSDFRPRQSSIPEVSSSKLEIELKTDREKDSDIISALEENKPSEQKGRLRYSPSFEIKRQDKPPSKQGILKVIGGFEPKGNSQAPAAARDSGSQSKVVLHQKVVPVRLGEIIQNAYLDFKAGRYQSAELLYQQALNLAPDNRDALLGLAAIATEDNRWQQAFQYYSYLLNMDSNDEYAKAGVLSLTQASGDSANILREINVLLEKKPNVAYLHFLKATALAKQEQWAEAQKTFYQAYSLDNINPDYAYNLAISLDHLGQEKEALAFYRRALFLGGQQLNNFSNSVIVRRMKELRENIEVLQ